MYADQASPMLRVMRKLKLIMIKFTDPLTKLGIVLAVVDRILVPNCSAAIDTNKAQYPVAVPNKKQTK